MLLGGDASSVLLGLVMLHLCCWEVMLHLCCWEVILHLSVLLGGDASSVLHFIYAAGDHPPHSSYSSIQAQTQVTITVLARQTTTLREKLHPDYFVACNFDDPFPFPFSFPFPFPFPFPPFTVARS